MFTDGHAAARSVRQNRYVARVWGISTLVWLAIILWITLNPSQPTDGGWVRDALVFLGERGLPAWVTYDVIEVAANVVLFVPFGLLLGLAYRGAPRLLWPTVLGLALSLAIEFSQAAFLPARFPTVSDVAANAVGALIGAALAAATATRPKQRAGHDSIV